MLEKVNQSNEKSTITFAEYMRIQVAEIKEAKQNPEFIKHVQEEFNLDSQTLPTRNQFAEIWNKDNSKDFREKMEA